MSVKTFQTEWGGRTLTIETGRFAHQADASCTVTYGETVVLATAVMSSEQRGLPFFPLMVDYEEKYYAAGKIKGSRFIKKEGRPSDQAVLAGRMIDRGLRPLFDDSIRNDIQVITSVMSFDEENDPDVLAIIAASCVLHISRIPWDGPLAGVRVGRKDGEWLLNPTYAEREKSEMDFVISATSERLLMIEADAKQVGDDVMGDAIEYGMSQVGVIVDLIEEVRKEVGAEKVTAESLSTMSPDDIAMKAKVEALALPFIEAATEKYFFGEPLARKVDRAVARGIIKKELSEFLVSEGIDEADVHFGTGIIYGAIEDVISAQILKSDRRVDGRKMDEIRALSADAGIVPRTHGSALFSRGETQIFSTVTLAGPGAEQVIDTMEMDIKIGYMHHYSFPPFSVGEAKPMRGPGRREIGHGALAEKALIPVLPEKLDFPYTIRVTSETMGSNGSSSMGSVCGSTIALMDAGVPLKAPVAGLAIGLASTPDMKTWKVFTDLQDLEDGQGGMDFKVAGTRNGVTAVQLDTKTIGIDMEIVREAFKQAKVAREQILDVIDTEISSPREELSVYAPRIVSFKIDPDKIRDVIGAGGKIINEIIAETGVEIDIEDDGTVAVTSKTAEGMDRAVEWIKQLTADAEVGKTYKGKVVRLMDFGAFVEILPGKDGMVHISELAPWRVDKVTDIVKEGQEVFVKVIEIDSMKRVNLSMKQAEGNVYPDKPKDDGLNTLKMYEQRVNVQTTMTARPRISRAVVGFVLILIIGFLSVQWSRTGIAGNSASVGGSTTLNDDYIAVLALYSMVDDDDMINRIKAHFHFGASESMFALRNNGEFISVSPKDQDTVIGSVTRPHMWFLPGTIGALYVRRENGEVSSSRVRSDGGRLFANVGEFVEPITRNIPAGAITGGHFSCIDECPSINVLGAQIIPDVGIGSFDFYSVLDDDHLESVFTFPVDTRDSAVKGFASDILKRTQPEVVSRTLANGVEIEEIVPGDFVVSQDLGDGVLKYGDDDSVLFLKKTDYGSFLMSSDDLLQEYSDMSTPVWTSKFCVRDPAYFFPVNFSSTFAENSVSPFYIVRGSRSWNICLMN